MSFHRRIAPVLLALTLLVVPPGVDAAGPRVVWHGPRGIRTIALTIDDGWSSTRCARMYGTLVATGVPATWFPNAIYVKRAPRLWRRIAERFPIGNHTYSHPDLTRLPSGRIRRQIRRDQRVIESITGRPMAKILRPPYGEFDRRVLRIAAELGYGTVAMWERSDADSSPRTTVRSGSRAAERGRAGSIILLHCGPAITPPILARVIRHYACAGYRFVTIEGLLARDRGVEAHVRCGHVGGPGQDRAGPPPTSPRTPPAAQARLLVVGVVDVLLGALRAVIGR